MENIIFAPSFSGRGLDKGCASRVDERKPPIAAPVLRIGVEDGGEWFANVDCGGENSIASSSLIGLGNRLLLRY